MSSMSYCLFRNTHSDFDRCVDKIGSIDSINELSAGESGAARDIRDLAERYIEWFDQLTSDEVDDE